MSTSAACFPISQRSSMILWFGLQYNICVSRPYMNLQSWGALWLSGIIKTLNSANYLSVKDYMDTQTSPPVRTFLMSAILFMILGWGGLYLLLTYTTPSGGARWAFFFAGVLAFTGTALPLVAFLNRRFPSIPPPSTTVVLRQALWIGIYFPTLVWLQIGRVLNPFIALLLAVGFALIEWLLRMRERSQWLP